MVQGTLVNEVTELKHMLNLLSMDLGASNGRGILGKFDGDKLLMEEMHRFENHLHNLNGKYYWDAMQLFGQIKTTLAKQASTHEELHGIGIDTWGIDYGLLDGNGQLLGNVISYRESRDEDMEAVWDLIPPRELFQRTGIANVNYSTIFQLYARKRKGDLALNGAESMLLLPDLLAYFLTGEKATEYTNGTTTMLMNPNTKDWDWEIIDKLGFPRKMFTGIQKTSTLRGHLLATVGAETGLGSVPLYSVGTHDTASAIAAIPVGTGNFAYLSSGTWSLLGVETDEAIISNEVYHSSFSNEGSVQGGYRLLKNIMGMALIQQCRREWLVEENLDSEELSWSSVASLAEQEQPFQSLIDPDSPDFFLLDNMQHKIRSLCRKTNQPSPERKGEFTRCIYESLALKYRWGIEKLEKINGEPIELLHIVGGGANNKLLNQFTANAIGKPVIAGPTESACMGNLLSQAIAMGELNGINELREVVRRSTDLHVYHPQDTEQWDEAYGRFQEIFSGFSDI